jgi:ribosomal protein S1
MAEKELEGIEIETIVSKTEDQEVHSELLIKNDYTTKKSTIIVDNYFDFDSAFEETDIPRYRDLKEESKNPTGRFPKYLLEIFKKYEGMSDVGKISDGQIVNGRICIISDREIHVDIGNKDNVVIDKKGQEEKICKNLEVGQIVDVLVTKVTQVPFSLKGSISELVKMKVDKKMKTFFENNIPIEGKIKDLIPAGYLLDMEIDNIIIDAFMPNTLADVNKLHDYNSLLGEKVTVMLETLQQDKGIYVVSRKKYLKTLIPEKIKALKKQSKDKVYTGHVTGTREFGIFVQFEDCLTGMIHKANIGEEYRDKLKDIIPGTLIDFYIKDIIKNGEQIILSQFLTESLWDTIRVCDKLKGKVLTVKFFGALVEFDYDTNGLIQNSYINRNGKTLKDGDIVDVVVISIIRDDRKIYLTFADDTETINRLKEKSDDLERLKQKFNNRN